MTTTSNGKPESLEVFSDTSPFQYLHQLGCLEILPKLLGNVIVPPSVRDELMTGLQMGYDVPNLDDLRWVTIRKPGREHALPLAADLGRGESGVLELGLESECPLVILDDGLARIAAERLGLRLTGTLGLLLDAKTAGVIQEIAPILDQLDQLRFRISKQTRVSVLRMAKED